MTRRAAANDSVGPVIEGGQVYHLHWDHIQRPVLATNAAGTVVWAARYLPFGGIDQVSVDTGAIAQTLRFPGQWFQAETGPGSGSGAGLHQNWMRDYDPTTGRYLQADPLGLVDGASVYGYARQSPVRYVDPRGEFIPIVIGIVVGLAVGEMIDYVQQYCTCQGNLLDDGIPLAAIGGGWGATGPFVPKPRAGVAGGGRAKDWTSVASTAVSNRGGGRAGSVGAGARAAGRIGSRVIPGVGAALILYDLWGLRECLR